MKQLKSIQSQCLANLASHNGGKWRAGCGWEWGSPSRTENILRSLVPRGLVVITGNHQGYDTFELSAIGAKYVEASKQSAA